VTFLLGLPNERELWKFSADLQHIIVPGGFEPGRIYELVYEPSDPAIAGVGLAAVRDIVSFFKYGSRETLLDDQRHFMKRAIGYAYSHSAHFLRQFVYDGLNQDEKRRKVFDGIFAAAEYWARAGSLVTTSLDAGRDTVLSSHSYVYFITGTPHAGSPFPPAKSRTRLWGNFAVQWPVMRALLLALQDWLVEGKEPPPSRYPRIEDGQLVPFERVGFPKIPGMPFTEGVPKIYRLDFGLRFLTDGLVSHQPPILGDPLPLLDPSVEADGNERAGIRLPHLNQTT